MRRTPQAKPTATSKLLDAKVITPQEGDVQFTAAATAEATVRADRATVAQRRSSTSTTPSIRAPISAERPAACSSKRGNLVRSGGATPLVVINQVRPILVRFAIPSSQLPLVLQYGAQGGLPVAAVPGGVAPAVAVDRFARRRGDGESGQDDGGPRAATSGGAAASRRHGGIGDRRRAAMDARRRERHAAVPRGGRRRHARQAAHRRWRAATPFSRRPIGER